MNQKIKRTLNLRKSLINKERGKAIIKETIINPKNRLIINLKNKLTIRALLTNQNQKLKMIRMLRKKMGLKRDLNVKHQIKKLSKTLKAAFEVATSGRPGPVVVDIPKDVQTAEISEEDYEDANIAAYSNRILAIEKSRLNEEKSSEFFAHLSNSKKPLIYFGGGVISASASKELREFVDYFNLPAVSTLMGLGAVAV